MKNKVIFIIIVIVLILVIGFFIFKTKPNEENNTLNTSNVQNIENTAANENIDDSNTAENVQNTSATVNNTERQEGEENNNLTIKQEVSPNGFMGSSLYKVVLYSNNEAYLLTYDGNGYDNQNMVSRTLIAKNVNSISVSNDETHLGEVIVKGGIPVNQDMGWIVFE